MLYTIESLREEVFQNVNMVYEVFKNFFGEEHTDIIGIPDDDVFKENVTFAGFNINEEGVVLEDDEVAAIKNCWSTCRPTILVWWPRVTVTNENNKSVVIRDLYAKIVITMEGTIPYEMRGFQLNRTTYTKEQFISGYTHSHVPCFYGSRVPIFENPCLGRGPINHTIVSLKTQCDEIEWMLFCQELSLYVTVESLTGGPYIRLESIGSTRLYEYSCFSEVSNLNSYERQFFTHEKLQEFILWYLKNGHLRFNYQNERFQCGMPYYEFMIDISNAFIDWFNETGNREDRNYLFNMTIIEEIIVSQGKFYRNGSSNSNRIAEFEGTYMLSFKGEPKCLHVENEEEQEAYTTLLLNHQIAMFILERILRIINYRYYNEHNKLPEAGRIQEGTSSTHKTVCYI